MRSDLLLLAIAWALWCAGHSLLITARATAFFRRRLGGRYAFFRLAYNIFALLTLLPVVAWSLRLPGADLLVWRWPWTLLQALLWLAAAGLFVGGARVYPLAEFLGIAQIRGRRWAGQGAVPALVTDGVLSMVRHPWYLAALLVLWGRDLDAPALVTSAVLSLYLVIGAHLEEARLLKEFGDDYRRYRREVSMLVPWKWLLRRMQGGTGTRV